ncbi:MAG TPA: SDR family oxidoreductase [Vicinamibacterales bacterium]|nr:SDR family oxidoreductase [Vicinamibacterales bacterium]
MTLTGKILITGASTGIGHACAIQFARLGYDVLAGVRQPADREAFQAHSLPNITPVLLDVTRPESIEGAKAAAGGEGLAGLVNNAGIAVVGPLELVPIEEWRRQFEVNVIGLVAVTQAFLPLLRRGHGRIVNIGSIAGRSALPGSAAYDASKFAIEAITDALRMELVPWGISVSLIEPGAVATPVWQKTLAALDDLGRRAAPDKYALYAGLMASVRKEAEKPRSLVTAGEVVKAVQHAMTAPRPRTRYLVGRDARLWLLLNLLPDRWRDRVILGELNKQDRPS